MLRREKALLWGQISEKEILMDLHVLRSIKPKITFLAYGLSVRVCFCVSVPAISITQKQIVTESSTLHSKFALYVDAI